MSDNRTITNPAGLPKGPKPGPRLGSRERRLQCAVAGSAAHRGNAHSEMPILVGVAVALPLDCRGVPSGAGVVDA